MKWLKRSVLALFLPFVMVATACAEPYKDGEQYKTLAQPQATASEDKIEVVEFFWYGCGHCYNFEPMLGQWKKTLGDDVDFQPTPAMWNPAMELHAKAFYAAEVLGVGETMHPALFQAMNVDRKQLKSEAEIALMQRASDITIEVYRAPARFSNQYSC